jgi:hypothetical protein
VSQKAVVAACAQEHLRLVCPAVDCPTHASAIGNGANEPAAGPAHKSVITSTTRSGASGDGRTGDPVAAEQPHLQVRRERVDEYGAENRDGVSAASDERARIREARREGRRCESRYDYKR